MTAQGEGGFALSDPQVARWVEDTRERYNIPALVLLAMEPGRFTLI